MGCKVWSAKCRVTDGDRGGVEPRAKLLVKGRGEGWGWLTEKFLAIGDSSRPHYLAKARGTSASRS